ncbi:MAG: MarR family transcriptional regulator [Myxococcales bacterium]|nr:MarR family transcriptional regulator [Myxococcales bacterium]MCB9732585.1 MarR family transcriptional regulator [Deltaproteobacteria bacterium]
MERSGEREFAHQVLRTIRQIVRQISEHSKTLSKESGLTVPQLICLKAIGDAEDEGGGGLTVAGLAADVALSAPTTSRIVDRLVRADLVARERSARDRRQVVLTLTASGRARFAALPVPLQERFLARLMALPEDEREVLLSSLERVTRLMDAEDLDASPLLTPEADLRDE